MDNLNEKLPFDYETQPSCLGDVIRWVAVSELLPEIGKITDIYISSGHRVTNYRWEVWDLQNSFMPHEITHWISIPEPPCL
jgi:hypothetical protein